MAKTSLSLCSVFVFILTLSLLLIASALPVESDVPEGGHQGDAETIDQTILQSFGGLEEEKKAEESRKKDDGVETEGMDTLLTPEQARLLHDAPGDGPSKRRQPTFITLWTDAVVPYDFGVLGAEHRGMMQEVFEEWQKYTCVRFVPAQPSHQHKIVFVSKSGCYSYLGMTHWSQQDVSLADGCHHKGTYLHELGHAMGLVHEHQLPQRDSYIYIDTNNVENGLLDQFTKYPANEIPDAERVTYSLRSIMHYGKYAFSKGSGLQTIHAKDKSQEHLMGSSSSLAFSDVKVINLLYNCAARCNSPPSCQDPCFVNEHCQCFCKEDIPCNNVLSDADCEKWAGYGFCTERYVAYMTSNCPKTCGFC